MIKLFLIFALMSCAFGARILAVVPIPAKSHHNFFQPILQRLAEKGHNVTYLTSMPMKKPHENINQISMESLFAKFVDDPEMLKQRSTALDLGSYSVFLATYIICQMGIGMAEPVYGSDYFQNLIHSNDKYDVVLFESFNLNDPINAFIHKFDAFGIDILAAGDKSVANEFAGLPDNPSYMVDYKSMYTDDMTFFKRLHNSYVTATSTLMEYYCQMGYQREMDRYFNYTGWESRPPIGKLMSDKALILLNSHHSTSYSYPKAPHVKEVAGTHIAPNKPLPKDMQMFLDEAKDGAIYFSLGTIINMTEVAQGNLLDSFIKAFGGLKQKVLWKWGTDNFPKVPPNVLMSKWFPQQGILAHKNTKIFITHGGYLSTSEAVYHGVPLIGIPFFSDQSKNLNQVVSKGFGIKLERKNLTEESIKWAVDEILTNPKYKENALETSALFKDRQMKPIDEAVYWIEYVIRHGRVLQPKSVHLSFWALHMIDIIGTIIIGTIVIAVAMRCMLRMLLRKLFNSKTPKSKKD